jgi:hypothetical protein
MFRADPTDHQATTLAAVGPSVHKATAITCRIVPVTTMIPLELMDVAPVILFFCFVASFYGHCLCACWWAELQVEPELEAEAELRVRLAEQEEDSGGPQGRVEQHWQGSQHLEGRRLRE